MKIKVNENEYAVIELVKNGSCYLPVLNIPMMSDEQWNELTKRKAPSDLAGYRKGQPKKLT